MQSASGSTGRRLQRLSVLPRWVPCWSASYRLGTSRSVQLRSGEFTSVGAIDTAAGPIFSSELLQDILHDFSFLTNEVWSVVLQPGLTLVGLVLLSRQLRGVARALPLGLGLAPCVAALFISGQHFIAARYLAPSAVFYHLGACVALFAAVDQIQLLLARGKWPALLAPHVGGLVLIGFLAARLQEYPRWIRRRRGRLPRAPALLPSRARAKYRARLVPGFFWRAVAPQGVRRWTAPAQPRKIPAAARNPSLPDRRARQPTIPLGRRGTRRTEPRDLGAGMELAPVIPAAALDLPRRCEGISRRAPERLGATSANGRRASQGSASIVTPALAGPADILAEERRANFSGARRSLPPDWIWIAIGAAESSRNLVKRWDFRRASRVRA